MARSDEVKASVTSAFDGAGDIVKVATLTKAPTDGSYDPATGDFTATPSQHSCRVLVAEQSVLRGTIEASQILAPGDMIILIAELAVDPLRDDTITFDGRDFKLVAPPVDKSAGTKALWECIVR